MLVLREREIIQIETQQLQNLEKQYRVQIGEEDPNKKADAADATKAAADNHPELTGGSSENLNKTKGDTSFKDEKNLAKLALGQRALGSADAYPAQRFDAELAYINPAVDASRGSVEVKLRVLEPPAYLRQDMTVSVDILTAERQHTLVMPIGALRDASSAAPWVLVVRERRLLRQPVTLGLLGDDRVEVLDGVVAGEPVILASLLNVSAGQRVRVRLLALP